MIRMLIMDVDGTLTDGKIYIGPSGEIMKAFDIKDGYAIAHMLPEMGIMPVIITGRQSAIVENRAKELGIKEIRQGTSDKLGTLKEIAQKYDVSPDKIAYIGDDLNDLDCIEYVGFTACPADAVDAVRQKVDYVCQHPGGQGALREMAERLQREG